MAVAKTLTKKNLTGLSKFYFLITIPLFLLSSAEGAKNNNTTYLKHIAGLWWVFLFIPLGLIAFHILLLVFSGLRKNDR